MLLRYAYIHPMEIKNSEDALRAVKATCKVMGEPIEIFSDEDTACLSVVKKYLDGLGIVQSRYAYIHPRENKNSEGALRAVKATFTVMGEPIEIFSDEDAGFLSVVKKYLDGLGTVQKTIRTNANIVERLIRTIKNGVADRIRFTKGNWTDLYKPTLKKYSNTKHSPTGAKPVEARKDENRVNVKVNLTLKQKHFRKYPHLNVGDKVKVYTKGAGNYIARRETVSRWSDKIFTIEKIDRDMTPQKYYLLEGLKRRCLRHDLLMVDD